MSDKRAVVLLSGGLDSSTVLYIAKQKGYECNCITFDYGQRHVKELKCAQEIAKSAGCAVEVINFQLPWGGSSLIDVAQDIPVREVEEMKDIPSTYVPARNTVFLSFALSYAEAIDADAIFIGANQVDYSGYPDCRGEYFQRWQSLMDYATRKGVNGENIQVNVPLLDMKKEDIIRTGLSLGVPYEKTWSCYKGNEKPCRECDSCKLRERAFSELGMVDPLIN